MGRSVEEVIRDHAESGRAFEAAGVESFVLDRGDGEPVVCVHGVPSSSFLYRKLVPLLAEKGLRGVAFDLPGLGLAERPHLFDYSWSGLAGWIGEAIDALGIERCHLVVHDIAGPIGCEWAIREHERVLSLTVLNTMLRVAEFTPPWSMRPFRGPLGRLYLATMTRFAFVQLMKLQGVEEHGSIASEELAAYYDLLKRGDGGKAFLRIMRGFELTPEKEALLVDGLRSREYPAQIVWGERDPALGLDKLAEVQEAMQLEQALRLPAKHFLQEDQAPALADAIAAQAQAR